MTPASIDPADARHPAPQRRATLSGPRISFLDAAAAESGAADPLLLLHGVGSSSDTWGELVPRLDGRRVIAPDYRGHGASDAPPPPYGLDDFVNDALRLVDELAIRRFHVLGFSIGSLFAERLAVREPDRVRSLVLLSSIANRSPEQQARAAARLALIASTPPSETAPNSAERWFTPGFIAQNAELVQREVDIVAAIRHAPYAASYKVLVDNDPIDAVAAIRCPTLIMTGENDEGSTPAMSEALQGRIAKSRLTIVPGVKHYLHIEQAVAVAAAVNAFLGALDPPSPVAKASPQSEGHFS